MRARLHDDNRLRTAALIGGTFRMDPIEVMNADYIDWWIRIVAMEVYWEERNKAESQQQR
jgi:hypothetical protein